MYSVILAEVDGVDAVDTLGRHYRIAGNNHHHAGESAWTDGRIIYGHHLTSEMPTVTAKRGFYYVTHDGVLYSITSSGAVIVGSNYPRILSDLRYTDGGWTDGNKIILSDEYPMCCKYVGDDLYSLCTDIEKVMLNKNWNKFELDYSDDGIDRGRVYLYLKKNNDIIKNITFGFDDLLKPFFYSAHAINGPNLEAACNGINPDAIKAERYYQFSGENDKRVKFGGAAVYPATPSKNGFTFFVEVGTDVNTKYYYITKHIKTTVCYYANYYITTTTVKTKYETKTTESKSNTYENTLDNINMGVFIDYTQLGINKEKYYLNYFTNERIKSTGNINEDLKILNEESRKNGWIGYTRCYPPDTVKVAENSDYSDGDVGFVNASTDILLKVDLDLEGNITIEEVATLSKAEGHARKNWGFTPIGPQININNFDLEYDDFTIKYVANGRNAATLPIDYDTIINGHKYEHFNILNSYTDDIGLTHVIYNRDAGENENIYQVVNIKDGKVLLKDETPSLYGKLFLSDTSNINLSFPSTYILGTTKPEKKGSDK